MCEGVVLACGHVYSQGVSFGCLGYHLKWWGTPLLWFVGVASLGSIPILGCNPSYLLLHVVCAEVLCEFVGVFTGLMWPMDAQSII